MAEPLPDIAPSPAPLPELPEALVGPGALPGLGPPPLLLDAPDGVHVLGPATVDSDADGRPDTAVVDSTPEDGALLLGTDLDADGHVDAASTIAADGRAVTATRGADGHFAPGWDGGGRDGGDRDGGTGTGPGPARDAAWTGEDDATAPPPAPPAPWIDPVTGTWTRWTGRTGTP